MFFKKQRKHSLLNININTIIIDEGSAPIIEISGTVPPGSEGNSVMSACFENISDRLDMSSTQIKFIIYDLSNLEYHFGDHLGAFLWILPALLDGVAIIVVATGDTRKNLESLNDFIGSWLPLAFFNTVEEITSETNSQILTNICIKSEQCSQQGKVIDSEAIPIVIFGSRQTGRQFNTGNKFGSDADLDCGVVGGTKELAILVMKASNGKVHVPNLQHPPTKIFATETEVVDQGYLVLMPHES